MLGVIMSIISGAAMSIQGVFNTRLSDKTGLLESNFIVSLIALILASLSLIWGKGSLGAFMSVNKLYLTGGVLSMVITITVMLSIGSLSPTVGISIILISQLLTAALIDAFGLFDSQKVAFTMNKIIGLIVMLGGIIIFSYKK